MRKYLALLLAVILFAAMLPLQLSTAAAEGETSGTFGDGFSWEFNESSGRLTISGSGNMPDFSSGSEQPWASLRSRITAIEIQDGVTSVGASAFDRCRAMTSVTMPGSVTKIGKSAFSDCTSLTSVAIPGKVTAIGGNAFYNCSGLTSVAIPNRVKSIGEAAFYSCVGLRSVTIGSRVTSIDRWAFGNCTELASVTLPDGMTDVGDFAFYNCHRMTSVTIPVSLTGVGESAFSGCAALTDVHYNGTRSDRTIKLTIGGSNGPLLNAQWHYLTEAVEGTVEWNAEDVQFKGTMPYVIANGSAQTPRFTVKNQYDLVIDPEYYSFAYCENTNAGTGYVIMTFKGDYSGTCRGSFKIYLPATATTTVENVSNGIKLTWSRVSGAAGYVIYRRAWSSTTNGWTDFVRWNNTTALNWTDTNVYAGTRYQYGIKAYFARRTDPMTGAQIGGNVGDNFNLGEVGPLKTTVRITTRSLNSVTAGTKQMTVRWAGSSNFTGYQIQYATNAAFTQNANAVKITNPKTVQTVIRSLTSGRTYYVRLRSYHEFNGMTYFGGWSNTLSCKVK